MESPELRQIVMLPLSFEGASAQISFLSERGSGGRRGLLGRALSRPCGRRRKGVRLGRALL